MSLRLTSRQRAGVVLFYAVLLCGLGLYEDANAARLHPERHYQEAWCDDRGEAEHRLQDGTRVDCLTPEYAVEVDFAEKWAEAVGQALHYAIETGRRPGILLIVERPRDCRYVERLRDDLRFIYALIGREVYPIRLWTVGEDCP